MYSPSHTSSPAAPVREVRLTKRVAGVEHLHIVRFPPGAEALVIDALADKVRDPSQPFDYFDAAAMSHEIGHGLALELLAITDVQAGE